MRPRRANGFFCDDGGLDERLGAVEQICFIGESSAPQVKKPRDGNRNHGGETDDPPRDARVEIVGTHQ